MTPDDVLYRFRQRTLALAEELGSVRAVARAYEAGLGVAFARLFAGELRSRVALPGYPFQHRRYWLERARRG